MDEILIGIIYINYDKEDQTTQTASFPSSLSEDIIEVVESNFLFFLAKLAPPIKKQDIFDFPTLGIKGLSIILNLEEKSGNDYNFIKTIYLLFNEKDDVIFYKYKEGISAIVNYFGKNLISLEDMSDITEKLTELQTTIATELEQYKEKEVAAQKAEEAKQAEIKRPVDYRFKIIICGDRGVGKTSTVLRYTDNAFNRNYMPTIGVNLSRRNILIDDSYVQLIIWDIGGQSKFSQMRTNFYQGAEGLLLMFDLTVPSSLESISSWHKDITSNLKGKTELIGFLLGNKNDLTEMRKIKKDDAQAVANGIALEYYETSALTGENVDDSFKKLAKMLLLTKQEAPTEQKKFDFFK